jgi:hypothetical protein
MENKMTTNHPTLTLALIFVALLVVGFIERMT